MIKLSRKRALISIQAVIIFLVLLAISFRIGQGETLWIWSGFPLAAVLLVSTSFYLSYIWVKLLKKEDVAIPFIQIEEEIERKSFDTLTDREKEICMLILAGKSNKEISSELHIALSTVKTHVNNIFKALNITSRKQLKERLDQNKI